MKPLLENEPECCPKFEPAPWDEKILNWENKLFIKDRIATFFYMPLNFGAVMRRLTNKVSSSGAKIPDYLCLSEHTSKWKMNVYMAVDKEVADTENTHISGKFFSKVYEGPFQDTGKWCADFESIAKTKGLNIKKEYMWYTTCPKCAKKYGKNYVVLLAQLQ